MIDGLARGLRAGPRPVAVLAGAGVSQTAGVATGQDLLRQAAAARGEDPGADPVAWFVDAFGHFPNYFAIVQGGADDQPTLPRRVFEGNGPTPAHRALAEMAAHGLLGPFLTTNFDRLLERALTEAGLTPRVARDLPEMTPEPQPGPLVVKLHGDYLDLRIRGTPSRLHTYHPVVDALLDRVLSDHDLLVCGWSASWDLPLGAALIRTAGRRRTYWLQCGEPTRRAREIMAARDALVAGVNGSDEGLQSLATAALARRIAR